MGANLFLGVGELGSVLVLTVLEADVATSTRHGTLFSEVVLNDQTAAFGLVVGVPEDGVDMFSGDLLAESVAFGSDTDILFGQTLFSQDQHRAAIARDIPDNMQLPELFEQLADMFDLVPGEVGDLLFVDGNEVAEQPGILAKQDGDDVVQFPAGDPYAVEVVPLYDKANAGWIIGFVGQDQVAVLL